jgi:hypothetical protein
MAWQTSMTLMTRLLIADLADPPTYSDTRLQQLILLGARYVQQDVSFSTTYSVNMIV